MIEFAPMAAIGVCAILVALTFFQLALAAGAPLGHMAWGGQHRILPKSLRIGSVVSIGIYAAFGIVLLDRAGLIDWMGAPISQFGAWFIAAYGLVGTLLNAISRSRPERLVMTPVAAMIGALAAVVALS